MPMSLGLAAAGVAAEVSLALALAGALLGLGLLEGPERARVATAFCSTAATWSRSKGFSRKSKAPFLTAETAVSTEPWAVSTMTGRPESSPIRASSSCMPPSLAGRPSRPGMRRSVMTASKAPRGEFLKRVRPASASASVTTS